MSVFSIDNVEREELLKRLRNHRALIITIIYLIAAPYFLNKSTTNFLSKPIIYISSWVFTMILFYFAISPRRSILKVFTIEFKENHLVVYDSSKKPKIIYYDKICFIGKTLFGTQLYSGFVTRVWIPRVVIDFEEISNVLDEKVPRKVFNPIRNPILFFLLSFGVYSLILWNQFSLVGVDGVSWITIYITNVIS